MDLYLDGAVEHVGDGTQYHHWRVQQECVTHKDFAALVATARARAGIKLMHAACVHDPDGYWAHHWGCALLSALSHARVSIPDVEPHEYEWEVEEITSRIVTIAGEKEVLYNYKWVPVVVEES